MSFVLYCDGASRGNPGPASIGAVLYFGDVAVAEISEGIGETTNNVAEYRALIAGLERALELDADDLEIRLDSLLLVKQIDGEYRVKAPGLKPLHARVMQLIGELGATSVVHVPREENTVADALANAALDR